MSNPNDSINLAFRKFVAAVIKAYDWRVRDLAINVRRSDKALTALLKEGTYDSEVASEVLTYFKAMGVTWEDNFENWTLPDRLYRITIDLSYDGAASVVAERIKRMMFLSGDIGRAFIQPRSTGLDRASTYDSLTITIPPGKLEAGRQTVSDIVEELGPVVNVTVHDENGLTQDKEEQKKLEDLRMRLDVEGARTLWLGEAAAA